MEKLDAIRGPVERSTAIRMILQYIITQDPNFLRRLLGLPEIADLTFTVSPYPPPEDLQ